MVEKIKEIIRENIANMEKLEGRVEAIAEAAELMAGSVTSGGKIILFGNGGSAADSQHIAAELIGRFKTERGPIRAIALTTNTSSLTAIANDYGYDAVFERQLDGIGEEGDVAIGISTSGRSKNVIAALKKAKEMSLKTIALTGGEPGELGKLADISIPIDTKDTPRVQELHILVGHIICELLEEKLCNKQIP